MSNNPQNVFLTDNRRAILEGESDWSDQSIANEKSRIRTRSRMALKELIEVANSPEIDNSEVFDADTVNDFLIALMTVDKSNVRDDVPGGLTTNIESATDDYQDYINRIQLAGAQPLVRKYGETDTQSDS